MSGENKIIVDENLQISDEQRQEVQEGLSSLKNWLIKRRAVSKNADGEPDYQIALDNLDKTQVFLTEKGADRLIEAVQNGELHLTDKFIQAYGGKDKAMASLQKICDKQGDNNIAFNARGIVQEPTVFLNLKHYEQNKGHLELRSISSLVTHEATHAIGLKFSENMANVIVGREVNDGVEYSKYRDSGKEVYARVMQLRHDLKLNPEQEFTLDDVSKMRQDCMEKRQGYQKVDGKAAPENLDTMLFERYSDEQIQFLLNATSEILPQQDNSLDRYQLALDMKRDFAASQAELRVKSQLYKTDANQILLADNQNENAPKVNNLSQTILQKKLQERCYS